MIFVSKSQIIYNCIGGVKKLVEIIDPQLKFRGNFTKRNLSDIDLVVLHHSGSAMDRTTIHSIHRWHLQLGWLGCGYHYVIHPDGSIFQGRSIDVVGSHARGHNDKSIGICVVGNFEEEYPLLCQQKSLGKLLVYFINDKLRGQSLSIKRHKDITATLCPGKNFSYFIPVSREIKRIDRIERLIQETIYNLQQIKNILKRS